MPFASTSSVADLLKNETQNEHEVSESLMMPALQRIRNRADYVALLRTFYGFFHPLEAIIARHLDTDVLPDLAERRNSKLILHDLRALNAATDGLSESSELPSINNTAEALGALYVLEGSTLGGRLIGRMLLKNETLHLTQDHLHFFNGYGEATGPKWKDFVQVLNAQTHDLPLLVRAANETFRLFTAWIRKNHTNDPKD